MNVKLVLLALVAIVAVAQEANADKAPMSAAELDAMMEQVKANLDLMDQMNRADRQLIERIEKAKKEQGAPSDARAKSEARKAEIQANLKKQLEQDRHELAMDERVARFLGMTQEQQVSWMQSHPDEAQELQAYIKQH